MKALTAIFAELLDAFNAVIFGGRLTPEDCRVDVPAWRTKDVQPKQVPKTDSKAIRIPGDALAYEWRDTSVGANTDALTPLEWGYITDAKATTSVQVAALVKRGIADGLTAIEIATDASMRLGVKVSVSQVQKVSAALSKAVGDVVAKSNEFDLQID